MRYGRVLTMMSLVAVVTVAIVFVIFQVLSDGRDSGRIAPIGGGSVEQSAEESCVKVPVISVTVCDMVTAHGVRCVVAYKGLPGGGAGVSCDWIGSP